MDYAVTLNHIGRTTLLAIGAADIVKSDTEVYFTVKNAKRGLQKIKISLVCDLYQVEYFHYGRNYSVKTHTTVKDVYADNLSDVVFNLAA
jgi:hypothetical protein